MMNLQTNIVEEIYYEDVVGFFVDRYSLPRRY